MSEKLEILYSQGQYTLALAVARTQHLDAERVADVHRHYGDFLYARGEHDGAMAQYVQTIGSVQPSYVIRKVDYSLTEIGQKLTIQLVFGRPEDS